jgi:hypothetical protein
VTVRVRVMASEFPCDYCGKPAFTVTKWGYDQACFSCAVEADEIYRDSLRGHWEALAQAAQPLGLSMVQLVESMKRHVDAIRDQAIARYFRS